jgi:hypothetical protein
MSEAYRMVPVYTKGICTARGYLVPPRHIKGCRQVQIPEVWIQEAQFSPTDSTTVKGQKAVRIVVRMLRVGMFPLGLFPDIVEQKDIQINLIYLIVRA